MSVGREIKYTYQYKLTSNDQEVHLLNRVTHFNDLGIEIDQKLDFHLHINTKINKAYYIIGLLRRNFKYLTNKAFILLYKSMVRSYLEYNNSVWNPYKSKDIEDLERVQKRATKIQNNLKKLCYIDRLKVLELPTLKYRRLRGDMIETYKILTGKYDCSVVPNLSLTSNTITRGHSYKLETHRTNYDLRKHFFTNRIVKIWNSLPLDVVNSTNTNMFKNHLDKFWMNQPCKYDFKAKLLGTGGLELEI